MIHNYKTGEWLINLKSVLIKAISDIKNYVTYASMKFIEYWINPVTNEIQTIKSTISASESKTQRLVISAMLCAITAIMQSAGALGGPGFAEVLLLLCL